jgi:hypothetical protein
MVVQKLPRFSMIDTLKVRTDWKHHGPWQLQAGQRKYLANQPPKGVADTHSDNTTHARPVTLSGSTNTLLWTCTKPFLNHATDLRTRHTIVCHAHTIADHGSFAVQCATWTSHRKCISLPGWAALLSLTGTHTTCHIARAHE